MQHTRRLAYFEKRARKNVLYAERTASPMIAEVHLALVDHYHSLAAEIRSMLDHTPSTQPLVMLERSRDSG